MGIFLLVLKTIGLILLWLLIIILAVILYFLIFPFHYDISVRKYEEIGFNVKVRTFLLFVTAGADKEDGGDITPFLRLFWGLLKILPKKKTGGEKDEAEEKTEAETGIKPETEAEAENEAKSLNGEKTEDEAKPVKKEKAENKKEPENITEPEVREEPESEAEEEPDSGDKIEKLEKIKDLIFDEDNPAAIKQVLSEAIWLLKGYMPKKFYADFEFSAGTPDGTGEILAVMAILPVFMKNKGRVVPDFLSEDPYFKGVVTLKGNVAVGRIIAMLVRIISHKECRHLIKNILEGIKNGKGK